MNIETALVIDNTTDGTCLQVDKDTHGYSITVFPRNDDGATIKLDRASLVRITNFLNEELSQ